MAAKLVDLNFDGVEEQDEGKGQGADGLQSPIVGFNRQIIEPVGPKANPSPRKMMGKEMGPRCTSGDANAESTSTVPTMANLVNSSSMRSRFSAATEAP